MHKFNAMKTMNLFLSVALVGGVVGSVNLFAEGSANPYKKSLRDVPVLELPAKAAEAVKQAKAADRDATAVAVLQATTQLHPASVPVVLAAVSKATPEQAAIAAAAAAERQPDLAPAIVRAAVAAAPRQASKVVSAVSRKAPSQRRAIAIAATEAAPLASSDISLAVYSAADNKADASAAKVATTVFAPDFAPAAPPIIVGPPFVNNPGPYGQYQPGQPGDNTIPPGGRNYAAP